MSPVIMVVPLRALWDWSGSGGIIRLEALTVLWCRALCTGVRSNGIVAVAPYVTDGARAWSPCQGFHDQPLSQGAVCCLVLALREEVCDRCSGEKTILVEEPRTLANLGRHRRTRIKCPRCGGVGVVMRRVRIVN